MMLELGCLLLLVAAVLLTFGVTRRPRRRGRPPVIVYTATRHDIDVFSTAGLKFTEWLALTDDERAKYRESHVRSRRG